MQRAIDETGRRREKQEAYNAKNGIVPETIYRTREEILQSAAVLENLRGITPELVAEPKASYLVEGDEAEVLADLEQEMRSAAANLEFEKAAHLRDEITRPKEQQAA